MDIKNSVDWKRAVAEAAKLEGVTEDSIVLRSFYEAVVQYRHSPTSLAALALFNSAIECVGSYLCDDGNA